MIVGFEEEEGAADSGPSLATLLASGSASAGEGVFAKCTACHTIAQGGADGIGPNLYGVMGTGIGQHVAGFAYSSALSGHGGEWNFENMDAWLTSPRAFANGTKMSFAGLSNPEDRANVILYLLENGGCPNLSPRMQAKRQVTRSTVRAKVPVQSKAPMRARPKLRARWARTSRCRRPTLRARTRLLRVGG